MPRRIAVRAIAAALCLTALTACSDDETKSGGLDPGGESSTSAGTPTETTPTESTSPPAPDPGGVTVEVPGIATMVAPKGWKLDKDTDTIVGANDEPTLSSVTFIVINPDPSSGAGGIDMWAKSAISNARGGTLTETKVLDPVEIDGVESYHVVGKLGSIDTVHLYGASLEGSSIQIDFNFTPSYTEKQRQEIMDSVLSTVEYLAD